MLRRPAAVAWALALLGLALLLPQLELEPAYTSEARPAEDTLEMLQGAWLREYESDGHRVRRVLTLEAGGAFRERVHVVAGDGAESELVNEGWWMFDGTNLKRKYTSLNGSPPSRLNVPFATFQISFDGRNDFTGVDHVHKQTVHYRRIERL